MKKVTKKELENILAQQSDLNALHVNVGALEVRKLQLLNQIETLTKQQDSLKKKLEKKYGSVNINLENGEITPIENEQDNKKN